MEHRRSFYKTETPLSSLASHIRTIAMVSMLAAALAYASLVVPGSANVVCSNVGTPIYCPVLAYGFPLPFLADSQGISPVGSVARDPLSLLIGLDDVLWPRLALTGAFWLLVTMAGRWLWLRRRRERSSH
jgi:hypothetical protein